MRFALAVALVAAAGGTAAAEPPGPKYADRWVYSMYNLQVGSSADEVVRLIRRAKAAGYTGVVLADYKFNILNAVPDFYFKNVARVKAAADEAGIELIPSVFPIGYSNGLLAHDPNLAEGLPVKDAPFAVRDDGRAMIESRVKLANGDFERAAGDRLAGMGFQDDPGTTTFVDTRVFASGKQSLRLQDATGNCRVNQALKVRPWACYRLSAKVKTRDLRGGEFKILGLGRDGRPLTFHEPHLNPTQDWTTVDVVFNSLAATEVHAYLGIWGGFRGTVWVDDWTIEEVSLVNVLRRDACPLVVKSADGAVVYDEGKDYLPVKDPKLGLEPFPGEYSFAHAGAELRTAPGSRIKSGDRLLVSWYHPVIIHGEQVTCSLVDPKVFDLLADQARRVNELLRPKTWFMAHDEIRVAGWCRLAERSGKTPGQLLADNARRCVDIIRRLDPKARVVVWSDMFDPYHNAVDGYYLVNGSLKGSWEGLPKDVVIANWNSGKAAESLRFFAGRSHRQVIAGYYDADIGDFRRWDAAAKGVPDVVGFMYTTWAQKYQQLEAFGRALAGK